MSETGDHLSTGNTHADADSLAVAKRLEAIGGVVSSLDLTRLGSRADVTRALCILELANKCIRVILSEIPGSFVRDTLIGQSERLIELIENTRSEVASIH